MGIFSKESPDGTVRKHAFSQDLSKDRKAVLKKVFIAFCFITICMYTMLPIYFGAYYRQEENAYRLTVRVIDLDSQYAAVVPGAPAAILGPSVILAVERNIAAFPHYHLGWQIADSNELSQLKLATTGPYAQGLNASQYCQDVVLDQTVFACLLINPNATLLATQAAQQGITAYDPRGAISFYYEEARNFYSDNQYVSLLSRRLIEAAIGEASSQFALNYLSQATSNATALTNALPVINGPFGLSLFNLRPFDQLAAEAPTTAGSLYLIIMTFFISPIWKQAYEPLRKHMKAGSDYFLRLLVPFLAYVWISLCYSLVTLAYHTDFTRKYGRIGFYLYWQLNLVTMCGLGYVMESFLSLFGMLLFPFFLVFWVLWNVSVAFLDLSDQDRFYLYGFAFPVWNSIDGSKSIIFGTKNHLVQNFAVNLAWMFLGAAALLGISVWQRNTNRDQMSNQDSEFAKLKKGNAQQKEAYIRQEEQHKLRDVQSNSTVV